MIHTATVTITGDIYSYDRPEFVRDEVVGILEEALRYHYEARLEDLGVTIRIDSAPEPLDLIRQCGTVWEWRGQQWKTLQPVAGTDIGHDMVGPFVVAVRVGSAGCDGLVDVFSIIDLADNIDKIIVHAVL